MPTLERTRARQDIVDAGRRPAILREGPAMLRFTAHFNRIALPHLYRNVAEATEELFMKHHPKWMLERANQLSGHIARSNPIYISQRSRHRTVRETVRSRPSSARNLSAR